MRQAGASRIRRSGRAVVIAILEEWSLICMVAVAAGATIMVAAMLYNDWSAVSPLAAGQLS